MKIEFTFEDGKHELDTPRGESVHVLAYLYNLLYKIETNQSIDIINSNTNMRSKANLQDLKSIKLTFEENDKLSP